VLCSSLLITAGLPLGVLSASDTARHSTAHCGSSAGAEACTECNLLQCRAPALLTPAAASTVKCTGWCQRIEHNSSPNPSTSPYATTAAANRPVERNGSLNLSTSPTRLCVVCMTTWHTPLLRRHAYLLVMGLLTVSSACCSICGLCLSKPAGWSLQGISLSCCCCPCWW
jgi:hypothetical protein